MSDRKRSSKKKRAAGISAGAVTGAAAGVPAGLLGALAVMALKPKYYTLGPKGPLRSAKYIFGKGLEKDLRRIAEEGRKRAIKGTAIGAGTGALVGGVAGHEISKHAAALYSRLTPTSSNVRGFSYDAKNGDLVITYKSGGTYRYKGVPQNVARSMVRNKSVGKTVHSRIKGGGYEYEKVGAKLAKSYTCKFCKEPATKGVIWAEGRAIVPACDKHLAKAKGSVDEVDTIRDLTKTSSIRLFRRPRRSAMEIAKSEIDPSWIRHMSDADKAKAIQRWAGSVQRRTKSSQGELAASAFPQARLLKEGQESSGSPNSNGTLQQGGGENSFIQEKVRSFLRERVREGGEKKAGVEYRDKGDRPSQNQKDFRESIRREIKQFKEKRASTARERFIGSRSGSKNSSTAKYYAKKRRDDRAKKAGTITKQELARFGPSGMGKKANVDGGSVVPDEAGESMVVQPLPVPKLETPVTPKALVRVTLEDPPPFIAEAEEKVAAWIFNKAAELAAMDDRPRTLPNPAASLSAELERKTRAIKKMAGAAKKQVSWQGITMKLEYEKGDTRSGVNGATGKRWERTMRDHYGYMPGTYGKGADGEAIDVYFNPDAGDEAAKNVYKIRQKKKTGEYDEDKFMVGYASATDAKKAFLRNMPEWAFGSMTSVSTGAFRKLVGQPGEASS